MTDPLTEITPVSAEDSAKLNKLFAPLNDVVIVALDLTEKKTPGGILLPEATTKNMSAKSGTIVAVGEGARSPVTGERVPLTLKVGDRVIFGSYAGSPLKYGDLNMLAMREPDCMTRVSDDAALQPASVQLAREATKKVAKKVTEKAAKKKAARKPRR